MASSSPQASIIRRMRRLLLAWFGRVGRDLPWRRTNDPYAIVLSELMLQQTQVDRVVPKWHAFLERFSTWQALADAPQRDVVTMWQGLGYNRRALNLHKLAKVVVERGRLPKTPEELEELPGIGPYTARAVAAFAFKTPGSAPVDTNIERVLKRVFGAHVFNKKQIAELAEEALPKDVWSWNHAMMDLGALTCTAKSPKCEVCPLKDICASYPCAGNDVKKVKQPKFEDSDRMYRGRIIDQLRSNNVLRRNALRENVLLADKEKFERILAGLVKDGLVKEENGMMSLV